MTYAYLSFVSTRFILNFGGFARALHATSCFLLAWQLVQSLPAPMFDFLALLCHFGVNYGNGILVVVVF
jgi:hypothetical protein